MHLGQLLAGENVQVEGSLDHEIRDIVCDSRQVQPHTLFVAIRGGQEVDRHFFVGDAAQRGAAAIVVEDDIDCGPTTRILVQDSRRLLPRLASRFQGEPSHELQCVGVTGTNGKTTTAWLLHNIQQAAGQVSAYIGTMGYICAESEVAVANTTPEAPTLQQLLRDALNEGLGRGRCWVGGHQGGGLPNHGGNEECGKQGTCCESGRELPTLHEILLGRFGADTARQRSAALVPYRHPGLFLFFRSPAE